MNVDVVSDPDWWTKALRACTPSYLSPAQRREQDAIEGIRERAYPVTLRCGGCGELNVVRVTRDMRSVEFPCGACQKWTRSRLG